MNQHNGNGPAATAIVEPQTAEQAPSGVVVSMTASGSRPYVPKTEKKQSALKENAGALLAGAGIVVALILFAFGRIPHQPSAAHRGSPLNGKQQAVQTADNGGSGASSILPITDTGHPQEQGPEKSGVGPDEIARTAKQRPQQAVPANLGGVAPFNNQQPWDAASFQQGTQPTSLEQTTEVQENKNERDAMDKPSLVFVKSSQSPAGATRSQDANVATDLGIGLPPGTRLRARLESMASTAVQTPVVAVVEYNYERGGEIIVPAGTRVFGHLEAADRTGYVGVRFESMMMPDGTSVSVEAAATDLRLRPLRGKVEGQQRGKNILVRSAAGVGEVMATLAGRGSLNQPLSEGDLLRERVSNNIAQASDEEVNKLAVTAHLVVSVPADTEIYIVLQKATKAAPVLKADGASPTLPASSRQSVEQLRQLLQLQKELSQESSR
jgi:hypothetical protein